jgi:hypothetical protein
MEQRNQIRQTGERSALRRSLDAFRQSHDSMPGYKFWHDPNGPVARGLERVWKNVVARFGVR